MANKIPTVPTAFAKLASKLKGSVLVEMTSDEFFWVDLVFQLEDGSTFQLHLKADGYEGTRLEASTTVKKMVETEVQEYIFR